jgi:hypothetical protein
MVRAFLPISLLSSRLGKFFVVLAGMVDISFFILAGC